MGLRPLVAPIPLACSLFHSTITKSGRCGIALKYRGCSLMVRR